MGDIIALSSKGDMMTLGTDGKKGKSEGQKVSRGAVGDVGMEICDG